ncbi:NAD(P)H-dependent oxidoreductase [Flavobacterium sp. '19STA2R22 D10 B1']|uniref:NAD(P)H-dependent oxidoreductase n=1 Tax=Flavobacterium aerium TaxID=3037261 RepID=UPI00278C840F|nr:NAD(P)H-dependent oxidoreductase [Flavobacterium sp. '19STA2R22 D10 B1']
MNHLIIYAHPNTESINHFIKETVLSTLKVQGHVVVVRDLYQLGFNPVLSLEDIKGQYRGEVGHDVAKEQEYIRWANSITFIYPIWWTGLPAIMKGYIDRVMTYGFAYRYDQGIQKGLLTGKQAFILNTQGKSHEEYKSIGMDTALQLTSDRGIFTYCGFDIKKHLFFEKADKASKEIIEVWADEIKETYMNASTALVGKIK